MIALALSILISTIAPADPISPAELGKALETKPDGDAAKALADRIRASFPDDALPEGAHRVEGESVAFAIEAPADSSPRVDGMINHGRGREMIAVGDTGLFALVESIPADTKFAYRFSIKGENKGGATVEMPGWEYPPESSERPGAKYGEYRPLKFRSEVFGNDRTGWIYVPAAYDGQTPAALMVFQDGDAYKGEHVGTVVDNLIADGDMPVTILVLLNPGTNDDGRSNRSVEYDTLSDRYALFLETEVLPLVSKDLVFREGPANRAIGGASSGAICAFTVAWQKPGLFGKVLSQIGSFTNIRGGDAYPALVRQEAHKPIKVVMTDGDNDLINRFGDWWAANQQMHAALVEKGYDVEFLRDHGFHAYWSGGHVLPAALRLLWDEDRSNDR